MPDNTRNESFGSVPADRIFDETIPADRVAERMRRDGIAGEPVTVLVRRKSSAGWDYLVRRTGAMLPDGRVLAYRLRRDGKIASGYPHAVDGHCVSVEEKP